MHELSCCTQNVYVAKSGDHVGIRLLGYNFPRVSGITAKRNTPFKMDKICRDIATDGREIYIYALDPEQWIKAQHPTTTKPDIDRRPSAGKNPFHP